jgi:non-ribosomal peptide synthase protein (TIGR01720 family)
VIETRAAHLQGQLDLAAGPLVRAAIFDRGAAQPGALLLIIHHLVVDGVSWRILLEDLETAFGQVRRGAAVRLPPKTTAWQTWAERLVAHAGSTAVQEELPYWRGLPVPAPLPRDVSAGDDTWSTAQMVGVTLDAAETEVLLQAVPTAYRTEINDVLLTAVAQTLARWTGRSDVILEFEGHGREPLFDELDVSRTVGWFTTLYPVWLRVAADAPPAVAVRQVKEQLRRIPRRGIGYGLLRYASAAGAPMAVRPEPEVSFNYMGQFGRRTDVARAADVEELSRGPERCPQARRRHTLQIGGSISGGRLWVGWSYSESRHRRATIETLAHDFGSHLRRIIEAAHTSDPARYSPSDFAKAKVTQHDLDKLMSRLGQTSQRQA